MKKRHFFFLLFVAQELGAKGSIAPSSPDDDKVDSSNKKKAALYMVRRETFAQCIFFLLRSSVEKNTLVSWLLFCLVADLWCIRFNESVHGGSSQSLQTGHVVPRGMLHLGQRGGPHHFCVERYKRDDSLKKVLLQSAPSSKPPV